MSSPTTTTQRRGPAPAGRNWLGWLVFGRRDEPRPAARQDESAAQREANRVEYEAALLDVESLLPPDVRLGRR